LFLFPLAKKSLIFADSKKIYYRVKPGDRLEKIANRYGVNVEDLQRWNKIKNPDHLLKNQRIVIYKSDSSPEKKADKLHIGQQISLRKPVDKWQVIRAYQTYGESVNPGILCRLLGSDIIKPANSGKIVRISQLRGYGKYILIDHGNGWHSMYSNLERIQVRLGQQVSLSDTIGNVKDNKLFFLLAYNGKPVNPMGYFKR
jgi:lipoprotein NlpD